MIKKVLNIDHFAVLIMILLFMFVSPLILDNKLTRPLVDSFRDLNITDIIYSDLREDISITADDRIVIINSSGLKDLHIAKILLMIRENGPTSITLLRKLRLKENPKINNTLSKILIETDNLIIYQADSSEYLLPDKVKKGIVPLDNEYNRKYMTLRDFPTSDLISIDIIQEIDSGIIEKLKNRGNDREIINWKGDRSKFISVDGIEILNGELDPAALQDKIILIGDHQSGTVSTNIDLNDSYFTPLNQRQGKSFPDMNSIYVHANIISMLLDGEFINKLPDLLSILITLLIIYANLFLFTWTKIKAPNWYEIISIIIFCIESLAILYLTVNLYYNFSFDLNMNSAIIGFALSIILFELYDASIKPSLKRIFSK